MSKRQDTVWSLEKLLAGETATVGAYSAAVAEGLEIGSFVGFGTALAIGFLPITVIGLGIALLAGGEAVDEVSEASDQVGPWVSPMTQVMVPLSLAGNLALNGSGNASPDGFLLAKALGPTLDFFGAWGPGLPDRAAAVVNAAAAAQDQPKSMQKFADQAKGSLQRGQENHESHNNTDRTFSKPGRVGSGEGAKQASSGIDRPATTRSYGVRDSDLPAGFIRSQPVEGRTYIVPDLSRVERNLNTPNGRDWTGSSTHFEYRGGHEHEMQEHIREVRDYPERGDIERASHEA